MGRDFLREHRLMRLSGHLQQMGWTSLEDLERESAREGADLFLNIKLARPEREALSVESVRRFRERGKLRAHQVMFKNTKSHDRHLIFLSHYKLEAGTEASLMRTEPERLLQEEHEDVISLFDIPVFLDSEDLRDLA